MTRRTNPSDINTIAVLGSPSGQHKLLIELADPMHQVICRLRVRRDRQLQNKDVRGNVHMVMIEKNNLAIAKVIDDWVVENVK